MAECDDRTNRRALRRVHDAGFPRPKRLEEFDFAANPAINPATIAQLAGGDWIRAGSRCVWSGTPAPGRRIC
jgi:DNA replication protein DnaC